VKFFKEICSLLDDTCNVSITVNKIKRIESKIKEGCKNRDTTILLSVSVVGRYSLLYWEQNYNKWVNKFGNSKKYPDINWRTVAKDDAISAGITATHLAVSGTGEAIAATGPEGWIGLGMIIAGSAIEGSAASILSSIW